jgi:hypothetical protein
MRDASVSHWQQRHRRVCGVLTGVFVLLHAPASAAQSVDHSAFDGLLRAHVTPNGWVDYDAFARSAGFRDYLGALGRADVARLPAAERLALWINAYNAYTIALVNQHGERRSIRNINRTLGFIKGKGPWSEPIARVGGKTYTLDQIEHEVIRKQFREPRIHFALVCAAMGCPPLRREAYEAKRLHAQLDDQARAFLLRSPAKNRVDASGGVAYLSPIFRWYREDFGANDQELLGYLGGFFPSGPERERLERGDLRVEYTEYDWTLNSQENGSSDHRETVGHPPGRRRDPASASPARAPLIRGARVGADLTGAVVFRPSRLDHPNHPRHGLDPHGRRSRCRRRALPRLRPDQEGSREAVQHHAGPEPPSEGDGGAHGPVPGHHVRPLGSDP